MAAPEESPATVVRVLRPSPEPGPIVVVIKRPVARARIREVCDRVRVLLEGTEGDLVVCDVGALVDPDAVTVDALARLQLTVRRLGHQIRFLHACGELKELLALVGLSDVVPCSELPLESGRQAEQREPPPGVEEEGDPADPVA